MAKKKEKKVEEEVDIIFVTCDHGHRNVVKRVKDKPMPEFKCAFCE